MRVISKKNSLLRVAIIVGAIFFSLGGSAQEKLVPHFFVEMTGGIGTSTMDRYYDGGGIHEHHKTSTYGQWTPSIGLEINDRWAVGVRMAFQTGGEWYTQKFTITSLYGQYSFLNLNRWSVFVEGKGSYYYGREGSGNTGEIGLSLGTRFDITSHLSAVLHYVYTGVEIGDKVLTHPGGCIGDGRYTLDFSPRRLQIGLRYSF